MCVCACACMCVCSLVKLLHGTTALACILFGHVPSRKHMCWVTAHRIPSNWKFLYDFTRRFCDHQSLLLPKTLPVSALDKKIDHKEISKYGKTCTKKFSHTHTHKSCRNWEMQKEMKSRKKILLSVQIHYFSCPLVCNDLMVYITSCIEWNYPETQRPFSNRQ